MTKLVLTLSAACFVLVAIAATRAILIDAGGPESAGPVPGALVLGTRPGEKATTPGERASIGTGTSETEPGVPEVDYMIDLNTGVMTPLPRAIIRSVGKLVDRYWPTWASRYAASPHGSLLAYVGTGDEGSLQIFTAGIDGTGVRQVTNDPRGAMSPAWSPDGRMIAYERWGSGEVRNLFVLEVATGEIRQVTEGHGDVWEPQFTPDGSSLLHTCCYGLHPPLVLTVPVAGGESTILFGRRRGGITVASNGSMSPDGSLVTMLGDGAGRFLANADGTELRSISGALGGSNPAGTWSPDGGRIVCSDRPGKNILVVDIATGAASPVAKGNGAIWLDGHTLLVEVLSKT